MTSCFSDRPRAPDIRKNLPLYSKSSMPAIASRSKDRCLSSNATCRPSSARAPAATRPWAGPSSARIRCVPWVPSVVTVIVSFAVLSAVSFRHNFMPFFLSGEDLCVLMTTGEFHFALTHMYNLSFSSPIFTTINHPVDEGFWYQPMQGVCLWTSQRQYHCQTSRLRRKVGQLRAQTRRRCCCGSSELI